jgi:hypothetical protein
MPRSTVQFQRGLSLTSFLATYGTEEQCREALYRIRWPSGFCCPRCGHRSCFLIKTRMLYQCTGCRTQTSLMSGTVFGCSKLPLTIWFLAIFLITQSKNGISSLALSRSTGISPTAALRMKHKLQQAMKNHDDSLALSRVVQIDDAYWGGTRHDGLVGRGASGKTPFLAAVETNEDGHPIFMRLSRIAGFTSHEIGRWVKHHVSPHGICVTDGLPGFRAISATGRIHQAIITGGGHNSMKIPQFKWVNTMLGNVKNAIHGTYHQVSTRHLPRYFAEFCFRFNNRFNVGEMIPKLIRAAARTPPIPGYKLKLAEDWW